MKTKFFSIVLFCTVLCFGFTSCDSDDDESFSKDDIVGVWDLVHTDYNGTYKGEKEIWSEDYDNELRVEFRTDGTGVGYEYYNRRWNANDEFSYTVSGNTLTIYDGDEKESAKIVTLNKNTLSLFYTYKDGSDYEEWTDTYKRVE